MQPKSSQAGQLSDSRKAARSVEFVPVTPHVGSLSFTMERKNPWAVVEVMEPLLTNSIPQFTEEMKARLTAIARSAADIDAALELAIPVFTQGSDEMNAAIVHAFRTNPDLKRQWETVFAMLIDDEYLP